MEMPKEQVNRFIRVVGLTGIVAIVMSIWSASERLPGSRFDFTSAMAPVLRVEIVHSKAELESVLGTPESATRKIIAEHSVIFTGQDVIPGFVMFFYFLGKLVPICKNNCYNYLKMMSTCLFLALVFDCFTIRQIGLAAAAPELTDHMAETIRQLALWKWTMFFVATVSGAFILEETGPALKIGYYMLLAGANIGAISAGYGYRVDLLIGSGLSIMFVALCGISALLLWRPENLYEKQIPN